MVFLTWKIKNRKIRSKLFFSLTNMGILCFKYVISMLWEFVLDNENSFHIFHIFESLQPPWCSWGGYKTQEADQELKWKLRTISVWENWVLEFLGSQSWDTRGGLARPPPRVGQYLKKPGSNRVKAWQPEKSPRFLIALRTPPWYLSCWTLKIQKLNFPKQIWS